MTQPSSATLPNQVPHPLFYTCTRDFKSCTQLCNGQNLRFRIWGLEMKWVTEYFGIWRLEKKWVTEYFGIWGLETKWVTEYFGICCNFQITTALVRPSTIHHFINIDMSWKCKRRVGWWEQFSAERARSALHLMVMARTMVVNIHSRKQPQQLYCFDQSSLATTGGRSVHQHIKWHCPPVLLHSRVRWVR